MGTKTLILNLASLLSLATCFAQSTQPTAIQPEAERSFERGLAASEQKEWRLAIRYFTEAVQSTKKEHCREDWICHYAPTPEMLFNLGMAYANAADSPSDDLSASLWLRAYLAAQPSTTRATIVRTQIARSEVAAEARIPRLLKQSLERALSTVPPGGWEGELSSDSPAYVEFAQTTGPLQQAFALFGDVDSAATAAVTLSHARETTGYRKTMAEFKELGIAGNESNDDHKRLNKARSDAWLLYAKALYVDGDCEAARKAFASLNREFANLSYIGACGYECLRDGFESCKAEQTRVVDSEYWIRTAFLYYVRLEDAEQKRAEVHEEIKLLRHLQLIDKGICRDKPSSEDLLGSLKWMQYFRGGYGCEYK